MSGVGPAYFVRGSFWAEGSAYFVRGSSRDRNSFLDRVARLCDILGIVCGWWTARCDCGFADDWRRIRWRRIASRPDPLLLGQRMVPGMQEVERRKERLFVRRFQRAVGVLFWRMQDHGDSVYLPPLWHLHERG